jgi:predicted extracellular nuclease
VAIPSPGLRGKSVSKTPWSLKTKGRFFQDWSNTGALLTTNASTPGATAWDGVDAIVGYRGDGLTSSVDPRTATGDGTQVVNLIANQANANSTTGGVAEFEGLANPVVGLQGSGTASAPNLVVYLDTTGEQNVAFSALLRDVDGTADNSIQAVALQYRIGDSGVWTNIAYVADASSGPNLATLTTILSATLPADANNQPLVEVRVITANAAGNDEWIGIDDITVTSDDITVPQPGNFSITGASVVEGAAATTTDIVFTVTRAGGTSGAADVSYTVNLPGINGRAGTDDVATGTPLTGTIHFDDGDAAAKEIRLTVTGDNRPEPNETFTVTLGTPSVGALSTATATGTITNDDGNTLAIYDIQSLGHFSGWAGQVVNTAGVVTAIRSNGFYLQDATGDGDARTSDAIFVATGTAPTVAVGNAITLSGTVTEYRTSTANLPLTELTAPTAITVTNATAALPEAVVIGTGPGEHAPPVTVIDDDSLTSFDPTTDGLDFYESLEGMRVIVRNPLVVANTDGNGQTYVVASNGVGATTINDRYGITISAGDNNPEKIKIYQGASAAGVHSQGDVLNDVSGILTSFGNSYEVDPTDALVKQLDRAPLARETTTLTGDAGHLSYVSFNIENFSPRAQDYTDEGYTLAYKLQALSTEIVSALKNPDIIGLQELQDNDGIGTGTDYTATRTAQLLIDAIAAAGGPTYRFVEVAPTANNISGGESNGNIRNGYLYNPERVGYVDGSARVLTDAAYNGTRKPLIADFTFNGQVFTAADMHSTSRGGSDALFGANQPPAQAGDAARTAQAVALKSYIDGVLANDPAHQFVVNGDFNGYYYENALQALQAGGKIVNLFDKLPVGERYSYFFDGYYQAFDNILVSAGLYGTADVDVVHYNAGYDDGLSVTDHDQTIARLGLARSDAAAVANNDAVSTTAAAAVSGNLLANDTGGGAGLAVTAVNGGAIGTVRLASGALVTVGADGRFTYDADGAFSGLAAGTTATDSFTYTAGGSTAV